MRPRNRDADRAEAERLIAMLREQVASIDEAIRDEDDEPIFNEMARISTELTFAADLLGAYAAGLALATPDPITQAFLVERRLAIDEDLPPVDEIVLIWLGQADRLGSDLPWLGHRDERGQWWFVDSGIARGVIYWAYRPGGES